MRFKICTYLSINELIFHWAQCWSISTRRSKVDHCEIWSFVKRGFLPSSFISQFVIMEIKYKHCKLRIEHFSHSPGQNLRLQVNTCWLLAVYVIKCCEWFNDDNIDIRQAIDMTLNDAYQLQPWIPVSVQNAYTLNPTSPHIRSRKKSFKTPFSSCDWNIPGEMGHFHHCWYLSSSHRQVISTD